MNRRTVLTRVALVVGGVGLALASLPFLRYFLPSNRAEALGAPVAVDLSTFRPGEVRSVLWRGHPVLVMKRSESHLEGLSLSEPVLRDRNDAKQIQPQYVDRTHRSSNPEFLVVIGSCTHLGCVPISDIRIGASLMGDWWPGGFHCPCHDSIYDYAGRVVRGPAPRNLGVPPHTFVSATELIIGIDNVAS